MTRGRITMKRIMIGLATIGMLALGYKELPALRRELKILRM
jgi:hypothetical protein